VRVGIVIGRHPDKVSVFYSGSLSAAAREKRGEGLQNFQPIDIVVIGNSKAGISEGVYNNFIKLDKQDEYNL
jgi:hypothetical protein